MIRCLGLVVVVQVLRGYTIVWYLDRERQRFLCGTKPEAYKELGRHVTKS